MYKKGNKARLHIIISDNVIKLLYKACNTQKSPLMSKE